MHHHNVVSNYFQNISESTLGWNPPLPVVSPSMTREPVKKPQFTGVTVRRAVIEDFMHAVASPDTLGATLTSLGITWNSENKGELVVVGTGIRVNQITLETMQAIDAADLALDTRWSCTSPAVFLWPAQVWTSARLASSQK